MGACTVPRCVRKAREDIIGLSCRFATWAQSILKGPNDRFTPWQHLSTVFQIGFLYMH